MSFAYSTQRLLEIIGDSVELKGDFSGEIRGIAALAEARSGDLSFLGNAKYRHEVPSSEASVLLLPKDYDATPAAGQLYILIENPSFALAVVCRDIERGLDPAPVAGIHPSAVVEADAVVAATASVGPMAYVGAGAVIEEGVVLQSHVSVGRGALVKAESRIFPNAVIGDYSVIGPRNRIQAGAVIGSDGYGYEYLEGKHERVPQIGCVVTEPDVDIGANTTIDRARFGETRIGQGTKIDNQVQIAHNVKIGQHCLIVSQVGISGSTQFGDGVIAAGQSGFAGHINIGSGAIIGAASGVAHDLKPGEKVRGCPSEPMMLFNRISVLQRKLPDLFKRFAQLEKSIESLASTSSD